MKNKNLKIIKKKNKKFKKIKSLQNFVVKPSLFMKWKTKLKKKNKK